jgi:hypothetical protein
MAEPKVTDWINASIKPTIPGVYQRLLGTEVKWARWNGQQWLRFETSANAAAVQTAPTCYCFLKWRGLAEAASTENGQRGSGE